MNGGCVSASARVQPPVAINRDTRWPSGSSNNTSLRATSMAILRIANLVLVSSLLFATAASAELGERDGRRGDRDRASTSPGRPDVRPDVRPSRPLATLPVIVRPEVVRPVIVRPVVRPAPPPAVIYEPRRPSYRFWQRDRDHRDFRGRNQDRRWYRWW